MYARAEQSAQAGDMETALALKRGEKVERETHPVELVFSDEQDLSGLAPRGY